MSLPRKSGQRGRRPALCPTGFSKCGERPGAFSGGGTTSSGKCGSTTFRNLSGHRSCWCCLPGICCPCWAASCGKRPGADASRCSTPWSAFWRRSNSTGFTRLCFWESAALWLWSLRFVPCIPSVPPSAMTARSSARWSPSPRRRRPGPAWRPSPPGLWVRALPLTTP